MGLENKKKKIDKSNKTSRKRLFKALIVLLIVGSIFTGYALTAYGYIDEYGAKGAFRSEDCPYNGHWDKIGDACCYGCTTKADEEAYEYRGLVNLDLKKLETEDAYKDCDWSKFYKNEDPDNHNGPGETYITGQVTESKIVDNVPIEVGDYYRECYACYNCSGSGLDRNDPALLLRIEYYKEDPAGKSTGTLLKEQGMAIATEEFNCSYKGDGDVPVRWCTHCGPLGAGYIITKYDPWHWPKPVITVKYVSKEGTGLKESEEYSTSYEEEFKFSITVDDKIKVDDIEYTFTSATWDGGSSDKTSISLSKVMSDMIITCIYEPPAPTPSPTETPTPEPTEEPEPTEAPEPTEEPTPEPTEPPVCAHVFGPWITVTSGKNGTCRQICTLCGYEAEAKAHTWVLSDSEKGDADENGNVTTVSVYTCTKPEGGCGDTYTEESTNHVHEWVKWAPDPYDWPMEGNAWIGIYPFDPNEYHWKFCVYSSCDKTSGKAVHVAGEEKDEGNGYLVTRCETCRWILSMRPVTVYVTLNPNGGVFPDGSTDRREIGPFIYNEITNLNTLPKEYIPSVENKEFFGFYVVASGVNSCFYEPDWDKEILAGTSEYFEQDGEGNTISKVKKSYTIHAQYRNAGYEVEYHPVSELSYPKTMANSYHDVGVPKELNPVGFFVTIPISYSTDGVNASVETTLDNTSHAAEFKGWALSEDQSVQKQVAYSDREKVVNLLTRGGTVHLYAVWDYGKIILPNATSADGGLKLSGWKDKDGTFISVLDATGNYTPTEYTLTGEEETFTAVWVPNEYTVTFDPNGGTPCDPKKVIFKKTFGTLPITTRKGHTFLGWKWLVEDKMITSESIVEYAINYELTAQWKINDVTVYLDYNFDFGPQAVNAKKNPTSVEIPTLIELNDSRDMMVLEYDSLYGVLPLPERDGYTFAGWYFEEDADGNGCGEQACLLNSTGTRVTNTETHTIHARWVKNQYRIDLDYNYDYSIWED